MGADSGREHQITIGTQWSQKWKWNFETSTWIRGTAGKLDFYLSLYFELNKNGKLSLGFSNKCHDRCWEKRKTNCVEKVSWDGRRAKGVHFLEACNKYFILCLFQLLALSENLTDQVKTSRAKWIIWNFLQSLIQYRNFPQFLSFTQLLFSIKTLDLSTLLFLDIGPIKGW